MQLRDKKLLIFDLDGTLIDSVPDLARAVNSMLSTLNLKQYSEDTIRFWVGNGASVLVDRALSGSVEIDSNLNPKLSREALELFLTSYAANLALFTTLYPHVAQTLQLLHQRGYLLAIATNKPYRFVEPILEVLAIHKLFACIVGGDTLKVKKPDPAPLLYVCEQLKCSSSEAVMIGDSKNDIVAANSAHIQSIGVTYGYNYGENLNIYGPTFVVDNFSKIAEIMQ